MMPTISRIVPTVAISMPETLAVTAKRRIAPSAIRKIDVPIPIVFSSRTLVTTLRYHRCSGAKHRNRFPANQLGPLMNSRLPAAFTICLAVFAALPTWASARSTQISIIQDDAKVIASGNDVRNATLDEMRGLGADVIKVSISWRELANGGKPSNPDDPNAYPAANWAPYDAAVQGAV